MQRPVADTFVLLEYLTMHIVEVYDVFKDKADAQRVIDINPQKKFQIIDKIMK